ncbi:NUDIX domain-containing protein [Streptomyces sp. NPDC048002]|uniref:NUDIX domain-containing protein n=1 Tax=Streptomyces sp. NPDC048002 TaxID=3154344 RepID=UPI0033E33508
MSIQAPDQAELEAHAGSPQHTADSATRRSTSREETRQGHTKGGEINRAGLVHLRAPGGRFQRASSLLQLRDDEPGIAWPGHWSMPGGGAEAGETPRETILRELREETHIVPDVIEEVVVTAYEKGKTPPHVFVTLWDGAEHELVLGEGQDLRLFPLNALPEPMPPHVRHYIEQLAQHLIPPSP